MTSNEEPEVGLAVSNAEEDNDCEVHGEVTVTTTGVLDALLLMPEKMDGLVERMKDQPFGNEVYEMANSLKIALQLIDTQNQKLELKDKMISELQQQLEVATMMKNKTEELADNNEASQKDEFGRHISDAMVMASKLQGELELAQDQISERMQEREKFVEELLVRANKICDLESKLSDHNRKLVELQEENGTLRTKLQYAMHAAEKSFSDYGEELKKCYQQDVKASEEIQKYKRIIVCVEGEIEQLNNRCAQCKMKRMEKEVDRLRMQMGLPKSNVGAAENVPGKCSSGDMRSWPKCVVCGENFSRSLDVTDYIRLLIITGEL